MPLNGTAEKPLLGIFDYFKNWLKNGVNGIMTVKSTEASEIFSPRAVKTAKSNNTVKNDRKIELNELAKKVAEQFSSDVVSPLIIVTLTRFIELISIFGISMLIYFFYVRPTDSHLLSYIVASGAGSLLYVAIIQAIDGYQMQTMRKYISQFSKVFLGFTFSITTLLVIGFFAKQSGEYSRVWMGSWYFGSMTFLFVFRGWITFYVKKLTQSGRLERRAVIVGGGKPAADLIYSLESMKDNDIRICGIFDDRGGDRSPAVVAGYPKLGTVDELVEFGRMARIDMLIVTLPMSAESRVLALLKRLWVLPVDIRLAAQSSKLRFRPRSYSYVGSVPFLDVFEKPIADWDALMKRIFDITFASLGLIAFSPIMLAAMIAIRWESKGPVIFRQKRYGFNNEVISVLKFRSMFHEMSDPDAKKVVTKGDPRVTKVGRFIRKTSIDELPQLINVLKSELSLVGPRPHAVNAHTDNRLWDEVVDGYFARHKVKPGVTGWAQINGWRGEVDKADKIQQRTNFDLYYIENWSLLFDLQIVFSTPFKLMNTENAY